MISHPAAPDRYLLEHEGRHYEIESSSLGLIGDRAVLFADGERVAEAKGELDAAKLEHDGIKIKVRWNLRHEIKEIRAEAGEEPLRFVPPPGTLLARRDRWERERPVLFAARHVAGAAGQIALGVLGIGAIIKLILQPLLERIPRPAIDLPDWHLPRIDLPDIPVPSFDLPDWALPGWLSAILHTAKFWGPIVVAIFVALNEIDKNQKKHARKKVDLVKRENDQGDPPADPK
ncbi:hypothetical protein [Actinocorallia longicatena]|uniref:Uncharacterized protein n=1 Tax=Actinocorallia longicatena TaxID=111803 RepID=A0ABP6QJU0_9ACTN